MSFAQRVVSGTSQLTVSNVVVRLFSILSMPILTRLLSPHAYGVAALAGTLISLVPLFAFGGIDMSYARAYHSAGPPNGAPVESYCWRFAIIGSLLSGVFGVATWLFLYRESTDQGGYLAILVGLGIVFSIACTMAYTRARLAGKYRAMSLTVVVTGLICLGASLVIAITWRQDALALLLPMLLGYLIPVLLLGMPSIAVLVKPSGLTRDERGALIKIGLAGVVTSPMYWFVSSSDRWFLQHYHGAVAVGIYSIGYSVAITGLVVEMAIRAVWLPEAAQEYERDPARAQISLGQVMSRLVVLLALIWLAVAAAGGDIVRWLADERFHAAAQYVPYLAGGVFFYGVLHLANAGLLLVKKLNWAALWWLAGGLVCTVLNLVLVPRYGGLGAAITQAASFAFISLGIISTSQAKFPIYLEWGRLAMAVLTILAAGVFLIPPWHETPLLSLLIKMPIGIAVVLIVASFVIPEWCNKGIAFFRRWALT